DGSAAADRDRRVAGAHRRRPGVRRPRPGPGLGAARARGRGGGCRARGDGGRLRAAGARWSRPRRGAGRHTGGIPPHRPAAPPDRVRMVAGRAQSRSDRRPGGGVAHPGLHGAPRDADLGRRV
ncbi:MAG: hypothetical protein AVDCRST_MAG32-515, partial [uncultured Nocardioides sp.]